MKKSIEAQNQIINTYASHLKLVVGVVQTLKDDCESTIWINYLIQKTYFLKKEFPLPDAKWDEVVELVFANDPLSDLKWLCFHNSFVSIVEANDKAESVGLATAQWVIQNELVEVLKQVIVDGKVVCAISGFERAMEMVA